MRTYRTFFVSFAHFIIIVPLVKIMKIWAKVGLNDEAESTKIFWGEIHSLYGELGFVKIFPLYSEKLVWLVLQILYFSFNLFTRHIDKYWPQSTILSSI